jgi:hypothetical protein
VRESGRRAAEGEGERDQKKCRGVKELERANDITFKFQAREKDDFQCLRMTSGSYYNRRMGKLTNVKIQVNSKKDP